MSEKFLTVKQAAAILKNNFTGGTGVTVEVVQKMIRAGRLPASRCVYGGEYLIKEADLRLVENRKSGHPKKIKIEPEPHH